MERSWSLAEWAHNALVPFSLSASGLAMEDLEKFCLCMPLTIGRLNKPASQKPVRDYLKELLTIVLFAELKTNHNIACFQMGVSPSSSLRSPVNSADSEREASEVRRDEPDEAWLGGRLPIRRLIQCSHKEELVDPKLPDSREIYIGMQHCTIQRVS